MPISPVSRATARSKPILGFLLADVGENTPSPILVEMYLGETYISYIASILLKKKKRARRVFLSRCTNLTQARKERRPQICWYNRCLRLSYYKQGFEISITAAQEEDSEFEATVRLARERRRPWGQGLYVSNSESQDCVYSILPCPLCLQGNSPFQHRQLVGIPSVGVSVWQLLCLSYLTLRYLFELTSWTLSPFL